MTTMLIYIRRVFPLLMLMFAVGCATLPTGPSVKVLPAPGKPFELFLAEDALCRQWAEQRLGMSPGEIMSQNTATGAVVGTMIGTGLGAVLGAASGNTGAGAAFGAGTGLLFGTAAGSNAGQVSGYEAQRRYDISYEQCMYAKGNQIPGMVIHRAKRTTTPPPPPPDSNLVPPDYVPSYPPER